MYIDNIISFDNIEINIASIEKRRIIGNIKFDDFSYKLIFTYGEDIDINRNIAGLILTMPAINFTYFARKLTLNFPVSKNDIDIIKQFMVINAHEVFINKIINRRYDYIKSEFIPAESDINRENADGITELVCPEIFNEEMPWKTSIDKVAIMSSGGKESLLAFGIFNEINKPENNYSFYFEESGSHWLTAKTAYDYYKKNFKNTMKVWSNTDRFYHEMLKHIKIVNQNKIDILSDDYPIQVFIFPVYIFLLLPMIKKYSIGNIIMGDEFDDPREMKDYKGLKYYYGIFDQTYDFNKMLSLYFEKKGINSMVYSIVYPVTGYLEEKILMKRYRDLFLQQRSCHSCHEKNGVIEPCGKCSKCLGILLFIEAAGGKPQDILYSDNDVRLLKRRIKNARLRLDPDERIYSESLAGFYLEAPESVEHAGGLHIMPYENSIFSVIPPNFRENIKNIFLEYGNGIYDLENDNWSKIQK
ncbi:metal-binding protein [Ferroplasma sp.]|uniref:metal-binding protein n=1 Tax=Ferroplasma sp. TaxID=2591003 RepID=UPI00307F79EA